MQPLTPSMNQDIFAFAQEEWFSALAADQQKLVRLAWQLYQAQLVPPMASARSLLADYSFVVFPAAKAYEGFLKDYLLNRGLITAEQHGSARFRLGRALNPDINQDQRDEWWLYDDVERECGKEVARQMWAAWLSCRNHLFHYFPNEQHFITLEEALLRLEELNHIMMTAVECKNG